MGDVFILVYKYHLFPIQSPNFASESNLPMSRGSSPSSCMILGKFLNQFLFYYKMGKLTLTLHCCCED